MEHSREYNIERLAGEGDLEELKTLLGPKYTQLELDIALENAIAYSKIEVAEYLISLGADISHYDYQGVYYSVHNNEFEGLKFSISKGVDVNVNNGMILNTSIITAINSGSIDMIKWLLKNGANPKLLTQATLKVVNDFGSDELKKIIKNIT